MPAVPGTRMSISLGINTYPDICSLMRTNDASQRMQVKDLVSSSLDVDIAVKIVDFHK